MKANPNSNAVDILRERVQEKWANSDDKQKVKASLIPIIIVGNKSDLFDKQYEPIKKK